MAETVECEAIVANTPRKCTVTFNSKSKLRDATVFLKDDRGTFPAKYSFDQSDSSVVVVRTEFDGASMTREEAAAAMDATNVVAYTAAMAALGEDAGNGLRRFSNLKTY